MEEKISISISINGQESVGNYVNLAGKWNVGLDVMVKNPYSYSRGPVKIQACKKTTIKPAISPPKTLVVKWDPTQ